MPSRPRMCSPRTTWARSSSPAAVPPPGPALVLFASGFAGSALEVVLLLAFQVLCGSVYHQVGVIVTVFMGGLAVGAVLTNCSSRRKEALTGEGKSKIDQRSEDGRASCR